MDLIDFPDDQMVTEVKIDGSEIVNDDNNAESDASLSDFIVNDDAEVEDLEDDLSADSGDRQFDEQREAWNEYNRVCLKDIIASLQRQSDADLGWRLEAEMLADLGKDVELCMRGVCAIYRRQIAKERSWDEGDFQMVHMAGGFSKDDAPRGNSLGDFLTDGNLNGGVLKTVEELENYCPDGAEICRTLATRYAKQLFHIYQTDEDEFFP